MRWRAPAVVAVLLAGLGWGSVAAAADAGLDVVTVRQQGTGGVTDVIADVQPPTAAPLPADAAAVTAGGAAVPAVTSALLDPASPVAVVLDASTGGAGTLARAASGIAGFLLRLPPSTPVALTADGGTGPAVSVTRGSPADAIHALTEVRPAGAADPASAIDRALQALPGSGAGTPGRALVLMGTTAPPPQAEAAARLADRLRAADAVLAVVALSGPAAGWEDLARTTGGAGVAPRAGDVAGAFDELARVLRARTVVRFTPPAGVSRVSVNLRSGGATASAAVNLPATTAPAVAAADTPTATSPRTAPPASARLPLLVSGVLAVLLAGGAVVVLRRRGAAAAGPAAVAPTGDADAPPGVRFFDVTDPHGPVEIRPRPPGEDPGVSALEDRSA